VTTQVKAGDEVVVLETEDPFHYLKPGTTATVLEVDSDGTYLVNGTSEKHGGDVKQWVRTREVQLLSPSLVGRVLDPATKPEDLEVLRDLPNGTILIDASGGVGDVQAAQVSREPNDLYDQYDEDDSPWLWNYLTWAGSDYTSSLEHDPPEAFRKLRVVWVPEAAE